MTIPLKMPSLLFIYYYYLYLGSQNVILRHLVYFVNMNIKIIGLRLQFDPHLRDGLIESNGTSE